MSADVAKFLDRFHQGRTVDDIFTGGCCYWFAEILPLVIFLLYWGLLYNLCRQGKDDFGLGFEDIYIAKDTSFV